MIRIEIRCDNCEYWKYENTFSDGLWGECEKATNPSLVGRKLISSKKPIKTRDIFWCGSFQLAHQRINLSYEVELNK